MIGMKHLPCKSTLSKMDVFFFSIIQTFNVGTSVALAAWIPGSMTTLALATAPITSALCQKYNCRYVTACGAILSACGIIASSFARTIQVTFLSFNLYMNTL